MLVANAFLLILLIAFVAYTIGKARGRSLEDRERAEEYKRALLDELLEAEMELAKQEEDPPCYLH